MSAPLTRTSAFAEVQDGDGAGGAGPTLERVELILAKWKYIYIYIHVFQNMGHPFPMACLKIVVESGLHHVHLDAFVEPTKHTKF